MRCPILVDLPLSSGERQGWPWTEQSPQIDDSIPNGLEWPKVSIVTPSYNQDQFIEENDRSVLNQGCLNLECIIMDVSSDDSSVAIIRKYENLITYWEIKPDHSIVRMNSSS